jgi:hypothetical protein
MATSPKLMLFGNYLLNNQTLNDNNNNNNKLYPYE